MQYHCPLVVGQSAAKNAVNAGRISHKHTASSLADGAVDPAAFKALPVLRLPKFVGQTRKVSGKTFIEPNVLPGTTGGVVTKPLVCQLMGK